MRLREIATNLLSATSEAESNSETFQNPRWWCKYCPLGDVEKIRCPYYISYMDAKSFGCEDVDKDLHDSNLDFPPFILYHIF